MSNRNAPQKHYPTLNVNEHYIGEKKHRPALPLSGICIWAAKDPITEDWVGGRSQNFLYFMFYAALMRGTQPSADQASRIGTRTWNAIYQLQFTNRHWPLRSAIL